MLLDDDRKLSWWVQDAHAPAVSAALMLEKGVARGVCAVRLNGGGRTAILGVLVDPPDGLAELLRALLRRVS